MEHIRSENFEVTKRERQELHKHRSFVIWFTGLPSSGKSTLANRVEVSLHCRNISTYTLDGDNLRKGLSVDLGFSDTDRTENIRRVAEVAKLFVDAGIVVLVASISPLRDSRGFARSIFQTDEFVEVFVDCPVHVCEHRDVKGLYKRARLGEITSFTGVSSSYEPPDSPDIHLRTDQVTVEQCVQTILSYVNEKFESCNDK